MKWADRRLLGTDLVAGAEDVLAPLVAAAARAQVGQILDVAERDVLADLDSLAVTDDDSAAAGDHAAVVAHDRAVARDQEPGAAVGDRAIVEKSHGWTSGFDAAVLVGDRRVGDESSLRSDHVAGPLVGNRGVVRQVIARGIP